MAKARYINPSSLPKPPGNFSWLLQSENIVWLAGMVGIDKNGEVVGKGDAEKQTLQIYDNIEAALKERGASLANLVKTVTYIVGREHMAGSMKVRPLLRQQDGWPPVGPMHQPRLEAFRLGIGSEQVVRTIRSAERVGGIVRPYGFEVAHSTARVQ